MISTEDNGKTLWRQALWLVLILRLVYSLFAAITALVQSVKWDAIHSNALTENLASPTHTLHYLLFGVWERFDTLWYLHIAAHGYDRPDAIVFFPLYPALIKVVSLLIPPMPAALLISTVAAFFWFWGLQELLREDHATDLVNKSVLVAALWPASFIFFAGYPEGLLCALIVWSLAMARWDKWPAASALGFAAVLTKAAGLLVVVPLLMMASRRKKANALVVLIVPLAFIGLVSLLHETGHASLASAYQQYWRTSIAAPWTNLWVSVHDLLSAPNPMLLLNLAFLFFISALVALSRVRIELLGYSAVAILFLLCKQTSPPLQSMLRYLLIVFPGFVGFVHLLQHPHLRPRFVMACAALFLFNLGLLWLFLGWSLVV
jgi:hypothetical protein